MFENIIGQTKAKSILESQLKTARVGHAYLFLGSEGVGRKKTALEFAKALNCASDSINTLPCSLCESCRKIDNGNHPDVTVVNFKWQALALDEEEKESSIGIKTIEKVQKVISLKKNEAKYRVVIIDPAEALTLDAANRLLKTLEEPPEKTIIILLAKNRHNLPQTIVSRTQIINFSPLSDGELMAFLTDNYAMDHDSAISAVKGADGSITEALKIIESKDDKVVALWRLVKEGTLTILQALDLSTKFAQDAEVFLQKLLNEAKVDFRKNPEQFRESLALITNCLASLSKNANAKIALDSMLLGLTRRNRCQ
ncbi:MAG: DNA polymerase III subunit delta' [Endomicrobiales bacterium]|nr:DNA polymerase III subunit delta' [Endomicrobiales bacterium]